MGITRTDLFTEEQNNLATVAKAIGHPARVAILQHLLNANTCINSDLVNELGLAQATISQHLQVLKNVGLISGNIDGTSLNYCVNSECWNRVKAQFTTLFESHIPFTDRDCCTTKI